jgi:hypothetical protein
MFSDRYKSIKIFIGTTLTIALCLLASVKGQTLELEKDRQFFYCINNAALCQNISFSRWIIVSGCENNLLIAQSHKALNKTTNRTFFLTIPCAQFAINERIRILGTFTSMGIFDVERFYIDSLRNTQIQWIKYAVSILGLFLAALFLLSNRYRDN